MMNNIKTLVSFFHFSEGLKNELRNGRTSQDKQESVAEHTWRVSLMVLVLASSLDQTISVEKALKIAIVHDLAELLTGDHPCYLFENDEHKNKEKKAKELTAMELIRARLPEPIGKELFDLWNEYEVGVTYEAKFVKAVDKIEAQIQHNEMDYVYWNDYDKEFAATRLDKYCSFDSFLVKIKRFVQDESVKKMISSHLS